MQFILKLIQFSVFVAVIGSNGQYHWTPNGYVAGIVGLFAAIIVTLLFTGASELWKLLFRKRGDQGGASGRAVR